MNNNLIHDLSTIQNRPECGGRSSGPQIDLQLVNPGLILQARRFYAEVDEEKLINDMNIEEDKTL